MNKYVNRKIKYFFVNIFMVFLLISITYAEDNKEVKKNFLIQNPISGVMSLVTEDGIVIEKTESGMNIDDIYHGGRQERLNINEAYYFAEFENEYQNNNEISDNLQNETSIIDRFPSIIDSFRDKEGNYPLDKVNTENFYIQKETDGTYTFVSTKYNYTLNNIRKFNDYINVVDQRAFVLVINNSDNWRERDAYLIDDDGRPVIMSSENALTSYYTAEKAVELINKEFIFINENAGYGTYMMIKRGKKANEYKRNYDEYSKYVYYGERQKEERIKDYVDDYISTDELKVIKMDGKYYIELLDNHFGDRNTFCLIGEDGSIVKNAIVKEDLIFLENDGKYKLYDTDGNLIYDDLTSAKLIQLGEVNFMYDEFKNFYLIDKGKRYVMIDKTGHIILDNIETGFVNTEKRVNKSYKEANGKHNDKYFSARVGNKNFVFAKDMKIVGINDDIFGLDVFSDGDYYMLHNDNKYKIYHKDGNVILSYEELPGRKNNNSLNNLLNYTPSIFYDYRRYFISNHSSNWYNIDAYQHNDIWALASGQWNDVDSDFPDFQFEDINGDLAVFENGKYNLYDKSGNKLLNDFKLLARYNNDYILFMKGFNYGLIDRNGKIKFELPIFDGMDDDE